MTRRVVQRGQIPIEKAIREELAIHAGDEVIPGRHRRSLAGSLQGKLGRTPPDESWPVLRDAARHTLNPDRTA